MADLRRGIPPKGHPSDTATRTQEDGVEPHGQEIGPTTSLPVTGLQPSCPGGRALLWGPRGPSQVPAARPVWRPCCSCRGTCPLLAGARAGLPPWPLF